MKKCKSCLIDLPLDKFTPSKVIKDGYENKCRTCRSNQRKKHKKECEFCKVEFSSEKKDARFCSLKCLGSSKIVNVTKQCPTCDSSFEVKPSQIIGGKVVYCSKECWTLHLSKEMKGKGNHNFKRVTANCHTCNKEMSVQPSKKRIKKYHFCSKECHIGGIGSTRTGELNGNYIRVECTCKECGVAFKRKPAEIRGETYCSNECRLKTLNRGEISIRSEKKEVKCLNCGVNILRTQYRLEKTNAHYCTLKCKDIHFAKTFRSGENAHNYSANKTVADRMRERNYPEYRVWRTSVYARDNYTCIVCEDNKGGNLIAHHLRSYAKNPTLRTEIDNGVTLCSKCHSDFHGSYGYYNNTEIQFDEFKRNRIR